MNNLQKNADGDQIAPSVRTKRRKRRKHDSTTAETKSTEAPSKKT